MLLICSTTAHAILSPSNVLVPRPISSKINKEFWVAFRKIVKGGADKSYGIQVAKLAGLPDSVIERAKEIVNQLVENDITEVVRNISVDDTTKKRKNVHLDEVDLTQMSLFDTISDEDIIDELKNVDIGNLTPLDALNKLYELQNKVKNRWWKDNVCQK